MIKSIFLRTIVVTVFLFTYSSYCFQQKGLRSSEIAEWVARARNPDTPDSLRLSLLEQAYESLRQLPDDSAKIEILLEASKAYYTLNKEDRFLFLNREALRLARDQKDSVRMAHSFRNYGFYHRYLSKKNDSAYFYFFEASKIYNNYSSLKISEGEVLHNMAIIQKNTKDYIGSEVTTVRALRCVEGTQEYGLLFSLFNNLAMLSNEFGRYQEAIENHRLALEYARKTSNASNREVISLNNLGQVYEKQQRYLKAIGAYEQALTYTEVLEGNPSFRAVILDNIAYAKFKSDQSDQLPGLFLEPLRICDSIGFIPGKIFVNLHLSEYYIFRSDTARAKSHALAAKDMAVAQKANNDVLKALLLLSEVSDPQEGVGYARDYIALNDSLQQQALQTRNQFARIRFETDVITHQKEQVTKQRAWLFWGLIVLMLVFGLIFVIVKQQQRNKELIYAQEQQKANEEIYQLMLSQQVKLEEGRQIEKRRISEELHDGVLGRLFGTRLGLDGLNQRQSDNLVSERSKYIGELASIEKEIRRISHDLSSNTFISEVAFVEVVEELIKEHSKVHKLNYTFEGDPAIEWDEISDNVKINLYRIIQESLQNIAKHAKAQNIQIRFAMVADTIKITIFDDGVGFKKEKVRQGIGLKNITSRTREIKGEVTFKNHQTQGAIVAITIPESG